MKTIITTLLILLAFTGIGQIVTTHILNNDLPNNAQFGSSVAINGDYAAIGSFYINQETGLVSIYKRADDDWVWHQDLLPEDLNEGDWFGVSLSMSEKYLVVGATKDHWTTPEAGKSYVFELVNGDWVLDGILSPSSNGFTESGFGFSSVVFNDEVFITAPDYGFMNQGAVVSYKNIAGDWQETQTFLSPGDHTEISYGRSLSVSEDWLAISTVVNEDGLNRQEIFLYAKNNDNWTYLETIDVPGQNQIVQIPAYTVDLSGNQLLVGNFMPPNGEEGLGGVFVYEFSGTGWELNQTIEPIGFEMQETGRQISQAENFALVGAVNQDPLVSQPHHMLVYDKTDPQDWQLLEDFSYESSSSLDWQGFSVDMGGDFGIIGTAHGINNQGEAFIFDFRNAISSAIDLSLSEMEVYPNPFSDVLFVNIANGENVDFQLLSQAGQLVLSGTMSYTISNDQLTNLPAGIYYLKLFSQEQTYFKKLIKE